MEMHHSSCKCNTDNNSVKICCFNPGIFFVCKLCRGAFKNVEKLILHKRQHHSLKDLKGIKFIIFEERFVETDDNTFRNEPTSTVAPLRCVSAKNLSDINLVPPVHQDDSLADPGIDIIAIPDESKEMKLPNPFVHFRRLTFKEINSYSRPTAATNQNQGGKGFDVRDQDERCDSTAKQNVSWDKTTGVNINAISIINCSSDSTSNKNVSADLTKNKNDPAPEIIADGEFTVANVFQSSDGIGSVQFVSACAPVNPEKESTAKKLADAKQQQQLNINNALCSDVNLFKTEKDSEFENSDSSALIPPSAVPVPLEIAPSLTEAEIKTEYLAAGTISNNSEVGELSVEVSTPRISAIPQTEAKTLVHVSPQSTARARPLRSRSKINYSENQTCQKCCRDFYTVEELETHEKLCSRNKTNRKREQLCNRGLKLTTISDGEQATHDDINDNDEIQVIQTASISSNPNDLEVKVTSSKGDQDYDFSDVISSSSDSEIEAGSSELNLGKKKVITDFRLRSPNSNLRKNKVAVKISGMKRRNIFRVIQHKVNKTEKPDDYTNCSLSLKDWIIKEKEANPENVILLAPDPLQAEADTNKKVATPVFVVTPQNPTKCKLCSVQLTSDMDAKRHLKYCWPNNKTTHVHCPMCSKSYIDHNGLLRHKTLKHSKQSKKALSFKCTICSKELASQVGFKLHMEVHTNPNLKPFICEICGSGFRLNYKLQRHKSSHSENRPFKCKLCPKVFRHKEDLRHHRSVHVKTTNYHCLSCNKSFKTNKLLQRHSRYHSKEKWYPCKAEHCDSKFAAKISVWDHCKKYHAELFSQLAKLSCTVCNEKFMFNFQLETHIVVSHGGEKRFKCSEGGCNGTFISKQSFKEHCRKHTGERPYQCDTCGSTFARAQSFRIHLKIHKNPKVPDAIDDASSGSSSESEVESEEGTTEESEPEPVQDDKISS